MSGVFMLYEEPKLRNPRLIIGLPDTGYVGLRVIDYLTTKLEADEFGRIEPREFSSIPWVSVKDGVIEEMEPLRNRFYYWKSPDAGNDLVLFKSEQPTAKHYEYAETVLDVAHQIGVKRIYVVGSFGAFGISHLDPPPVLGVVNSPPQKQLLQDYGIEPYPEYKGIGSIHSLLLWFAKARDMEAVGLWAPIPHYIATLPLPWSSYPRSAERLLAKLTSIERIPVNVGDLEALARLTEGEMAKIYDQLYEESKTEPAHPSGEQSRVYPEPSAMPMSDEEIKRMIKDIEDFFRKRKQ
jgi:proteasome assembly chaperone (PAC2) family protein